MRLRLTLTLDVARRAPEPDPRESATDALAELAEAHPISLRAPGPRTTDPIEYETRT